MMLDTKTEEELPEWKKQRLARFREQGVRFRLATPEDVRALVRFHNSYYKTSKKPEHWVWEYHTYAPDKSHFIIAEKDGQILATEGFIPIYMDVGGKTVLGAKGESWLCLKQYRGTGLQQALRDYEREQGLLSIVPISWSFTLIDKLHGRDNFATVYRGIQVWTRVGNVRLLILTKLRDNAPLWRRIGSVAKLTAKVLSERGRRAIPQVSIRPGYEIKKEQIPDEALIGLCERLREKKNKNVICIHYDSKYLSWRIREHPFLKYDEYQVQQDSKLRAYAFVTMHDNEAFISDLLSEDSYATSILLSTIVKDYGNKTGRLRFLGNPQDILSLDIFEQLPKFGFSLNMKWLISITDRVGDMNREFYEISNWNVNGLWTEGFQM
jgi:hypothetical protein